MKLILILLSAIAVSATAAERVNTMRTPDGGIQPQVAVAQDGSVHLIYYKGADGAGNIFYVRQKAGAEKFSESMQVNSQPGSAIAAGTIRGAQLAIGKNNRVHVIWNGGAGAIKTKVNNEEVTPLIYTRLNEAGTAFEPERNLITYAAGLDGGSSIAADANGNVYATWHGRAPNSEPGEDGRAVFVARSSDEGKTFSRETPATTEPTGACGCCGMRTFADSQGAVYILYRGAEAKLNRDEVLLISPKTGAPFQIANRHPWKIESCPMSSAFLTQTGSKVLAAWETAGQVFFAGIDSSTHAVGKAISPAGAAKRKHPVAVANSKGETLLAWTEGTAWKKGGAIAWQLYDRDLKAVGEPGHADGLPVWGLVAAYAKPDGQFVVIY
jgi:hypothetical protein